MPANGRWDLIRRLKVKVSTQHVAPTFILNKITSGFHSVKLWKTLYNCDSETYQYTFIYTK